MRTVDLIQRKRDGEELSQPEIAYLVEGYTSGEIPDYQMSAFLMAVYFSGMSDREVSSLAESMLQSGEVVDLSSIPGVKVDKHSTGGVGDKTSLVAAPLAAAAGVVVPMISGRALGHTGGTLDKLESIPGFRTNLTIDEFKDQLARLGLAFIGQTPQVAPADGKLYSLRDATATVESIPLIATSIMSKKLAAGIDALVLDVKVGSGAFMKRQVDARRLAQMMVGIGPPHGQAGAGADHRHEPAARLRYRQRAGSDGSFADPAERGPGGFDAHFAGVGGADDLPGQDHQDAGGCA